MMRAGPVVALIISVSEAANVRPRVYPLHGVACESEGDDEQLELGHDPMDLSWPRAEQIERCLATCAGMEDCAFFHVMTSVATDLDDCVNGGGSVETCAPWGECVYFSQCVPTKLPEDVVRMSGASFDPDIVSDAACTTGPWTQCGGKYYTGSTCCPKGYSCTYRTEGFSQCARSHSPDD